MRSVLASALALWMAAPATAAVVVIDYTGTIYDVQPPFASIASPGDPVSGRITYDTAAADEDPDPAVGLYPGATHEIHIGAYAGTSTQSAVRIFDDYSAPAFDGFQVIDYAPSDELPAIGDLPVNSFGLSLNASSDLYASDTLPASPPDFADPRLVERYAYLSVVPPGQGVTPLDVELTSLTVPEPANAALLAAGALALLRRRSR